MKRKPAYSQTSVGVGKSMDNIRQLVASHGATHIALLEHPTSIEVAFQVDGELPIRLRFNINQVLDRLREVHPQTRQAELKIRAERTTWRQVYHYLKATLEAVDIGIFTLYEGLLSGFTGPDGQTLGQVVAPRLAEWAEGQSIGLLPSAEDEEIIDL